MSSVVEEFLNQMRSGELEGGSEYMLRNELAQEKSRVKNIKKVTREFKKMDKFLIPMELAFPFNPGSGKPDEKYNMENKFRPLMSAESAALMMKGLANENEALKNELLRRAGMKAVNAEGETTWDTTNIEVLSELDEKVFRSYRVIRTFTMHVIGVRDKRITGQDFLKEYKISVDRDSLGQIQGKMPWALQVNRFFSQLRHNQVTELKAARQAAIDGKDYTIKLMPESLKRYDLSTIKDEDFTAICKEIYQNTPVTDDYPVNYLVVYDLAMDGEGLLKDMGSYENLTKEDLDKTMRLLKISFEIKKALDKFVEGTYKSYDTNFNFIEMDMSCPSEDEVKDPNKDRGIAAGTTYQNAIKPLYFEQLSKFKHFARLKDVVREHQDESQDLEKRFMVSTYTRDFTKEIESQILEVVGESEEIESPYLTQDVIRINKDLITKAFGKAGDMLVSAEEIGFSDAPDDKLDEAEASREAREANFEAILSSEGPAEETEDEEVIDGDKESQAVVGTEASTPVLDIETESLDD